MIFQGGQTTAEVSHYKTVHQRSHMRGNNTIDDIQADSPREEKSGVLNIGSIGVAAYNPKSGNAIKKKIKKETQDLDQHTNCLIFGQEAVLMCLKLLNIYLFNSVYRPDY